MSNLRPELEPLPSRFNKLAIHRGYPVPWFVDWVRDETGTLIPEFRAMNPDKLVLAIRARLCWVCGGRLGSHLAFNVGPMCGITRISGEPPSHLECAEWSARNCPFLSRPNMERRDIAADYPKVVINEAMIPRNPGVVMVWVCRGYEVMRNGNGVVFGMTDPTSITYWAEGKPATRAQIDHSITAGLPLLKDPNLTPEVLSGLVTEFQRLLPAA